MAYISTLQKYAYSTFFILILTIILVIKLCKIRNSRQFERCSNIRSSRNSRLSNEIKINIAVTLLFQSIIHSIIYLGSAICWSLLYSGIPISIFTSDILTLIGKLFDYLTIIVRFWNFYVYLIRIKEFREILIRGILFPFRICRRKSDGTEPPTMEQIPLEAQTHIIDSALPS